MMRPRRAVFVATCAYFISTTALAQTQPTCPKGFQPYANRCITQRMSDYIACVEASGGNSERIAIEVTNANAGKTGVGVKGSGSGVVVKGSGSVTVDRATEQALASKFEHTWTDKGMEECRKVLDPPKSPSPKSGMQRANVSVPQMKLALNPTEGRAIDVMCVNDSDFPAHNAACMTGFEVVKLDDVGEVSRSTEDEAFDNFLKDLGSPNKELQTLEPHTTRMAVWTPEKDKARGHPLPREVGDLLLARKATWLATGIIVWTDDAGAHKKEFCRYIIAPASPNVDVNTLADRTCHGHNKQLY